MKIGYACLNVTLQTKMRTCRIATVEKEGLTKVKELTIHNLQEVNKIIDWNIENNIHFFRLSSDIVPFGSHPILTWDWWADEDVLKLTNAIREKKQKYHLRLSAHPGQYTIINSKNDEVVKKAIKELEYHDTLLDLVGGTDMIIHTGGVYGDKLEAKKRFIHTYHELSDSIKNKLRLENDDKSFHLKDVLSIYKECGVPICFDIHHHNCNHTEEIELDTLVEQVFESWKEIGTPKVHISSGKRSKIDTAHHDIVFKEDFDELLKVIGSRECDIMLEAKQKEKAVFSLRKESAGIENTEE
ncbi:UV DNA damage repair endonuclease UvsE [Bacillus sp. FJAT-45350]|uniref:UV DNA damage repair endonuclease UvsE n=1 Tax=Bacillus sp. FJAT-45350 TaxID=2011014 RepID=UPI000BB6BB81|nr:UV DNA damage repair endonuclease UvsE [Bacillus sp. FJAT-45350]